ncbi:RNA-directed DNA polymerase from mobile element jockey-like, partial [Brachionus plicatilis]
SLLDLILVSDPNRVSPIEIGPPLVTSSLRTHCSLRFEIISKASRQKPFDSRCFNWRRANYASMVPYLIDIDWKTTFETSSIQNSYSAFLQTFFQASSLFVQKRKSPRGLTKPPWWNIHVAKLIRRKRRLFIAIRTNKEDLLLLGKYKLVCKQVK